MSHSCALLWICPPPSWSGQEFFQDGSMSPLTVDWCRSCWHCITHPCIPLQICPLQHFFKQETIQSSAISLAGYKQSQQGPAPSKVTPTLERGKITTVTSQTVDSAVAMGRGQITGMIPDPALPTKASQETTEGKHPAV